MPNIRRSSARPRGRQSPRRRPLVLAAAALLVAGGMALAWSTGWLAPSRRSRSLRPGGAAGYNVLLVTLDTVRRDHLGCYGDRDAATPTLDRLAAGGIRFDDAVTSVPLTLPSHATILTGLCPPNHGVRDNGTGLLRPEQVTLAETLRDHGYDTAAFIACFILDARFGLDQGFAVYDFAVTREGYRPTMPDFNERAADTVTDAAIAWLRHRRGVGARSPFFAWVHYFDAHLPYRSPLQGSPRFAGRPYDAEIAFVDSQLQRLLDELGSQRLLERTVVLAVADHGESLGEHGEQTHGMLLYDATVRVPFILSCPGLLHGAGRVDRRPVGLVDVRPTLEDLLGLPVTTPCDGRSLLRDEGTRDRALYIETLEPLDLAGWSPLVGLRTATSKLVDGPVPRFFDLSKDPREVNNLHGAGLDEEARLRTKLTEVRQTWRSAEEPGRAVSEDEADRLRSLGYSQAGPRPAQPQTVDPESMMPVLSRSAEAERLYAENRFPDAERVAREVLAQWPTSPQALRVLAFSLLKTGRSPQAVDLLRQAVAQSRTTFLVRSLAQVLILSQECAQAEEVLKVYQSLDPRDGRVHLLRGDCLARQNRVAEAIASYREAITLDDNRVGITARERIDGLTKKGLGEASQPAAE